MKQDLKWGKVGGLHDGGGAGDLISATILCIYLSLHDITVSDILEHGTSIVLKLQYKFRGTKRSKYYTAIPTSLMRNVLM